jgi:hypothetical protein
MGSGDRFHRISVVDGVTFLGAPGFETVLTFFAIRRATGTLSIVKVVKTFEGGTCVRREFQTKEGIAAKAIQREMDVLRIAGGGGLCAQRSSSSTGPRGKRRRCAAWHMRARQGNGCCGCRGCAQTVWSWNAR